MTEPSRASSGSTGWWGSHWTILAALVGGIVCGVLLNVGQELIPEAAHRVVLGTFDFVADIFIRLLKMLVAPLVLFSILAGVCTVGDPRALGRLGARTFAYYISTSLLAILTGLVLVNLIRPGVGAELNVGEVPQEMPGETGDLLDIFTRLVPENIFRALAELDMLQIITFALIAGFALTRLPERHRQPLSQLVYAAFELMTTLASLVLSVLPIAVFALVARVAARSAGEEVGPLLLYMLTVVIGLAIHGFLTLPLILKLLTGVSPRQWGQAIAPALMTAFSTSSSSATLPVTIECVEERGGVPNRIGSFVLPLGATINMDGTALYECVGTIFLAQFYATAAGYQLTLSHQVIVVVTALLASIGAAGIPSAGLVMMTIILRALDLPLEGALLILAVDRPLDMLRTATNVWSDSVGTAVIGSFEQAPPTLPCVEQGSASTS
ncbi:MAG: dicarboxylate/amino acid:cation symporter [Acidobacteriota bacterium]|nr:MAG: dicarboxylate/amino acid:cation symporter [Acidobacteriota bacterium]